MPCIEGKFPYGSHKELLTGAIHNNTLGKMDYDKFKSFDAYGTYLLGKPVLNITNVETIRHILVKDFNSFVDRNDPNITKMMDGGPLDQVWRKQMTALSGDEWKDVRSTFSPIFTSGKLKVMLRFIHGVGRSLKNEFGRYADSGKDVDLKDVFGKFSLDSLAECAFGINPNSFDGGDLRFVNHAGRLFTNKAIDKLAIIRLIPGVQYLTKVLGINLITPDQTSFFRKLVTNTINQRKESGEKRNDMVDFMIDCIKNDGSMEKEEKEQDQFHKDMELKDAKKSKGMKLDEDMVVATALLILIAGYDTTGITLSFLAYHLAANPEIQARLQEEIDQAFNDNNGKLPDYTVIQELPYIEMCILETLRMHPPVGMLTRVCTKDTTIPNYSHPIKKNDLLNIPVSGIHFDPRYYPNPKQFNPENFSKEARSGRSPYTFFAFGQGPRACLGMRFAMLEAKVALLEILSEYNFAPSNSNPDVFDLDPERILGFVKGGLFAKITKRN